MAPDSSEEQLRLLYLDWCSTQVAKRFLELSLDEVWLRSDFAASALAASGDAPPPDPPLSLAVDRIPGYLDLVRRTALLLAQELELPEYMAWKRSYLEDPNRYSNDFLSG